MIIPSAYGTGNQDNVFLSSLDTLIMSCLPNSIQQRTWLFLHLLMPPFAFGTSLVRTISLAKDVPFIFFYIFHQCFILQTLPLKTIIVRLLTFIFSPNFFCLFVLIHLPSFSLIPPLGLRKKSVVPMGDHAAVQLQNDLFGNTDAVIKFVLEGHEGVNWAAFHPTLPLIISGSDDRQLKLWRWSDTKAWEVETLRAHYNSVTSCVFHPTQEIMVSCAEDKTIRVWDMSKRSLISTYRKEQERFWIVTSHPERSLFAAGHDNGLILFKLEKERPAYAPCDNQSVFYLKDRYLRNYDFRTGKDVPLTPTKVRKESNPRMLQFNPAGAVLVTFEDNGGSWELYFFKMDSRGSNDVPEARKGPGRSAVWVARNRFAVWDMKNNAILVKTLTGETSQSIPSPVSGTTIEGLFAANNGCVLLKLDSKMVLYDVQHKREVAECPAPGNVKFAIWSSSNADALVAIMSKETLVLATSRLEVLCSITERTKIKSGVFNEEGIFLYTTTSHIKYMLPNGDGGIVRTLEHPIYMTGSVGSKLFCLDREIKNRGVTVDSTEYMFKNALNHKRYQEVLNIVRGATILGQSIVSYLQNKGFPEVALYFVKEEQTRFDLALECGNIEKALQAALKLERADVWVRLAEAALQHGNHAVVELSYNKTNNYERLSFLYLITGQLQKLKKMEKFAEKRTDAMSAFHNALYLGDVPTRIRTLESTGQLPLAYLTAKTHGMMEDAERIKSRLESRLSEQEQPIDIDDKLPFFKNSRMMLPPMPLLKNEEGTWPLLAPARGPFDAFLTSNDPSQLGNISYVPDDIVEESIADEGSGWVDEEDLPKKDVSAASGSAAAPSSSSAIAGDGEHTTEWDLEIEDSALPQLAKPTVEGPPPVTLPREAPPAQSLWLNSDVPADHIAAGSFETAMKLLNTQIGIVNFAPLKAHFLSIAATSHTLLSALPATSSLEVPLLRNWANAQPGAVTSQALGASPKELGLPVISLQFPMLVERLQAGYRSFTTGKFQDALDGLRSILHLLPVIAASTTSEAAEAKELIGITVEYILGLQIELKRKEIATADPSQLTRISELGAYFTHCNLQPSHVQLTLRSAMNNAVKLKNFASAYNFGRRLLDLAPKPEVVQTTQRVLQLCEQSGLKDEITIDYDERNPFVICAASMKPIYRGTPSTSCPYCGSHYHQEFNGTVCTVCSIAKVGAPATGLTLIKPIAAKRSQKRSLMDE
jgi:coatomer protein complex subunit alpha (xenin)